MFSVAVAVGSGLAAWLAAGRIVILPTLIGAVLLGVFAVDLGWTTYGTAARACAGRRQRGVLDRDSACAMMVDLAGLAIAGGLYIVPTFAAVQAWAGADRRARVIAGVNVLNAAFMVGGTVAVALLQAAGSPRRCCSCLSALRHSVVAIIIGRDHAGEGRDGFPLDRVPRTLSRRSVRCG